MSTGKLYLIPTLLGEVNPALVLPTRVFDLMRDLDYYIVENEKNARRFIKTLCPTKDQNQLNFFILNKHTQPEELSDFLNPCFEGIAMGLMSDAGCPGIADPGQVIVRLAHEKGVKVIPVVGPSSIVLTLMASGLNGQSFAFIGYLPIDKRERITKLKHLEAISRAENQTQLFIETPYRNEKLFQDLLQTLKPDTLLSIGRGVTTDLENISTHRIADWLKHKRVIELHKIPTVFALLAGN